MVAAPRKKLQALPAVPAAVPVVVAIRVPMPVVLEIPLPLLLFKDTQVDQQQILDAHTAAVPVVEVLALLALIILALVVAVLVEPALLIVSREQQFLMLAAEEVEPEETQGHWAVLDRRVEVTVVLPLVELAAQRLQTVEAEAAVLVLGLMSVVQADQASWLCAILYFLVLQLAAQ